LTNKTLEYFKQRYEVSNEVLDFCAAVESQLNEIFVEIDHTAEYNQLKVLFAMQNNRLSDAHFAAATGYGYNDSGRDTLEKIYADAVKDNIFMDNVVLFGPAYKGIPLAVTASMALHSRFGHDVSFCFNRKEAKDHGEGGVMVGCKLKAGDKVVIIEDVTTAGTSVRESVPLLKLNGGTEVAGLVVSVDRMERGTGAKSALAELRDEFGFSAFSIVNLDEIVEYLHNKEIDGKIVLNDEIMGRIKEYRAQYGADA